MALSFALAFPALLAIAGGAVDYAKLAQKKVNLQSIADGAALAAAKGMRLGNSSTTVATQVAQNFVSASPNGANISVATSAASDMSSFTVALTMTASTYVMQYISVSSATLHATASAAIVGGQPVCVIGLDQTSLNTIWLQQYAQLSAPGCSVYGNSSSSRSFVVQDNAALTAAFVCTHGGAAQAGKGTITPAPLTDCPAMPDPLASRPGPTFSGCTYTNMVVSSGTANLTSGVYCGGLTISGGATVTLGAGVYVFHNGPLYVTGGATLQGSAVGLYFTGKGAVLNFDTLSTISLSAPVDGVMAGILVWDDPASPNSAVHSILSDNARDLLGTIYLPRGHLHIGAGQPVADKSAYTIIVARQLTLAAGPTLVLNTNYSATNVPVPDGVGLNATRSYLIQ